MDDLTKLADKYGCDKGSLKHNYTKLYNRYLEELRDESFSMLEIGFGQGASAKMWLDYFPKATIFCLDINDFTNDPNLVNNSRFVYIKGSQTNVGDLSKASRSEKFQVIIDDGSHVTEDQIFTLKLLFPNVKLGGYYIIEDLNCKRNHNPIFEVEDKKLVDILKEYKSTGNFNVKGMYKKEIKYFKDHVRKIDIHQDKIVFIKKSILRKLND